MKKHTELTAQEKSDFCAHLHGQAIESPLWQDAMKYYKILSVLNSPPGCDQESELFGLPTDEEINAELNGWIENKEESI
jgi:hypothetical protein